MGLIKSLIDFFYPPFCIHCEEPLAGKENVFCSACLGLMELIAPEERCPRCFSDGATSLKTVCRGCAQRAPVWKQAAAAFDYQGPAKTLVSRMKYGNEPYLAKGLAAFMASQFIALKWPFPDVIVPVPMTTIRFLQRGYNQSALLANELGKILGAPVSDALKRRAGDFSQARLTSEERRALGRDAFYLAKDAAIEDKVILLIDDVKTTGTTLNRSAEALLGGFPQEIYVLTGCLAIH